MDMGHRRAGLMGPDRLVSDLLALLAGLQG